MSQRSGVCAFAIALAIAAGSIGCGGDGGGSGSDSATIGGNITSAPSASVERKERSLLAIIAEDVIGFARAAYAQVVGLAGIEISGGGAADTTDEDGSFDLSGVAGGDVELTLRSGDCQAVLPVMDVSDGATILLEDIDFRCTTAEPARVSETFEGVVVASPDSQSGDLELCVAVDEEAQNRIVGLDEVAFDGGTFEGLIDGQRVMVTGTRSGQDAESGLAAEVIVLLGAAEGGPCAAAATDPATTPTAGEPDATPTPGASSGAGGSGGSDGSGGSGGSAGSGAGGTAGTAGSGGAGGTDAGQGGAGGEANGGSGGSAGSGGSGGAVGTGGAGGEAATGGSGGSAGVRTGGTGGTAAETGAGGTGGTSAGAAGDSAVATAIGGEQPFFLSGSSSDGSGAVTSTAAGVPSAADGAVITPVAGATPVAPAFSDGTTLAGGGGIDGSSSTGTVVGGGGDTFGTSGNGAEQPFGTAPTGTASGATSTVAGSPTGTAVTTTDPSGTTPQSITGTGEPLDDAAGLAPVVATPGSTTASRIAP